MIMDATLENDIARPVFKNMAKLSIEGDEMRREVALHVRKIATIVLHHESLS